ncbi:MAG TPA: Gfo/Idh/MocA family oxidoreductase [Bacteroidales bacterium]|nr:Gfo/Idh/MocA family oxidoreductase [Bacteroidales bacterium]HOK73898.1 Gfo/Idh/MocA family oxidoreductase [Bacteroidales bacterium]HOM39630.1 Gfo/Idh/MocA family oxidoreductase [Bacteroidales bacterium]HPP91622.1 Gfo/Idh/MocA family oxidoreductase [Bacteroidales bacterium]HRR15086.1 Gfo/Idh/MocA family oxidoreductase [Bacteroidales bacterium]
MKRRNFIKLTGTGSMALATSFYISSGQENRKIKAALIGAGWYGMVISTAAIKAGDVEFIGVCDVDSDHLKTGADEIEKLQGSRPKTFKYYQEMLDMKDLDAVFIGTIPHWHALQFIDACKRGLHIYCEKPLSYDVAEGIAMVNAWKRAGNIVQIGFQRRQSMAFKKAKELIESGRIGEVRQIVAQIHYNPGQQDTRIQPPPPSLDWEEWCGPAPKLEYRPSIGHKAWRLEKEYGNGHLVDWGIHHIDIIRKIMGENMPSEFYTTGGIFVLKDQITTPDTLTAHMKFNKVPVVWQHRLWGNGDVTPEFKNGIFFYGEKGTIFAEDNKIIIFSAEKDLKREDISLPTPMMQDNHVRNFLDAVRAQNKNLVSCTPEDAFKSTATVQLAMISYYTDSVVRWDQTKNEIINNPEASKLLKREYRGKYVHP